MGVGRGSTQSNSLVLTGGCVPNSNSAVVRPRARRRGLFGIENSGLGLTQAKGVGATATFALEPLEPRRLMAVSLQAGWTVVTPDSGDRVIHVSTSGSDSNPGTASEPVKSI